VLFDRGRLAGLAFLFLAHGAGAAGDLDGLSLGANERAVVQRLPNAHCQPLEWESRAADRRCDDSRVLLAGLEVRVTAYLKQDAVQAYDVRFDSRDAARLAKIASAHFGAAPAVKDTEKAHTLQWRAGGEHGVLSTQQGQRRASLLVWRGDFYDEIYKVR
jgi:hypothetical protein